MNYTDLHLTTLDQASHEKTCGYWYLVGNGPYAHTAFITERGLRLWMEERGIELTAPLPERGTRSFQRLTGGYSDVMHWSYDQFYALDGHRTRTLSNGDWTMAIITREDGTLPTVHTLNPNCHDRPKYDHAECRATYF